MALPVKALNVTVGSAQLKTWYIQTGINPYTVDESLVTSTGGGILCAIGTPQAVSLGTGGITIIAP
jgi:hypothetical protein